MQVPNIGLSQQQQPPTQAHEIPINAQGNNLGLGRAACKLYIHHIKFHIFN